MLQTSALRAQVHSNGQMTGDQADAKEVRKCLLRKSTCEMSAVDEEQDTVAGVSVSTCTLCPRKKETKMFFVVSPIILRQF